MRILLLKIKKGAATFDLVKIALESKTWKSNEECMAGKRNKALKS